MKHKKKNMLRIGTLLCILIFLLVPLMSSPVAAAFVDTSTADTRNPSSGPQAWVGTPITTLYADATPRTATFQCWYTFVDTNVGGSGSYHRAILTVTKTSTPGDQMVEDTIWIYLSANIGTYTTGSPLQIVDTWTEEELPVTWLVEVWVSCVDIASVQVVADQDNWEIKVE